MSGPYDAHFAAMRGLGATLGPDPLRDTAVPSSRVPVANLTLRDAIREGTAATLAASIIVVAGKPVTPVEAVALMREVLDTLYPPEPSV